MILNSETIDKYKPSQILKAICLYCDNDPLDNGAIKLRSNMSSILFKNLEIEIDDRDFEYYCKEGFYQ